MFHNFFSNASARYTQTLPHNQRSVSSDHTIKVWSKQLVSRMCVSVEKLALLRNNNVKSVLTTLAIRSLLVCWRSKFWHPLYKRLYYHVIDDMMYDAMQIFHLFNHIYLYANTRRRSFTIIRIQKPKKSSWKIFSDAVYSTE